MKKILFVLTLLFSITIAQRSMAQSSFTVDADYNCWVVLINDDYAAGFEYGWWSVWQEMRDAGNYLTIDDAAPAYFESVPAGYYTLVLYTQDASNSDGVVLESIYIDGDQSYNYYFTADDFSQWNCLSCPFLYVFDGEKYVKTTEIIQDVVGIENKTTTTHPITTSAIIDGKVKIRIQEEKDEISNLDKIQLLADGVALRPVCVRNAEVAVQLGEEDNVYLVLHKGDFVELEFEVGKAETLELQATGYYVPEPGFIESVYHQYMRKK